MLLKERNSQRGIAIWAFAMMSVTFLMILALALTVGQYATFRSEVRTLSDTIALMGSSALTAKGCKDFANDVETGCTARLRWSMMSQAARDAAKRLPRSISHGLTPDEIDYALETNSDAIAERCHGVETCWRFYETASNHELFHLALERGWWQPDPTDKTAAGSFESLEADDWQASRPGLPRFVAVNAIKVSVRPSSGIKPIFSFLGSGVLNYTATSMAVAQQNEAVPVAPFAIPICSLVSQSTMIPSPPADSGPGTGDIDFDTVCVADRLFAPTSRYCPTGSNCRARPPQFNWDPKITIVTANNDPENPARQGMTEYWRTNGMTFGSGSSEAVQVDNFCFWGTPRYLEPEDNFGFVALPCNGGGPGVTEADVAAVISGQSLGTTKVAIGSTLCPLASGLTSSAIGEMLWQRIITAPTPGPTATPGGPIPLPTQTISSASTPAGISFNNNSAFRRSAMNYTSPPYYPTCQAQTAQIPNVYGTVGARWPWSKADGTSDEGTGKISQTEGGGTCNSRRSGWGFWSSFAASVSPTGGGSTTNWQYYYDPRIPLSATPGTPTTAFVEHFRGLPMWNAWVAVVADTRPEAEPCLGLGLADGGRDPVIHPEVPYKIVGFVRTDIYDVDIGRPPPSYPPASTAPFVSDNFKKFPFSYTPAPASGGPFPWAFTRGDAGPAIGATPAVPTDCDLVRSRISCKQNSMPGVSGSETAIQPRLVRVN